MCFSLAATATENYHEQILVIDSEDEGIFGVLHIDLQPIDSGYSYYQHLVMKTVLTETPITVQEIIQLELCEDYAILGGTQKLRFNQHEESIDIDVNYNYPNGKMDIRDSYTNKLISSHSLKNQKLYHPPLITLAFKNHGFQLDSVIPLTFFDFGKLIPVSTEVTITTSEIGTDIYKISLPDVVYHLNKDGLIYQIIKPTTTAIQQKDYHDQSAINALVVSFWSFKPNLEFTHPQRSIQSEILLTGHNFDNYNFTDNRQQILAYNAEQNQVQVVLDITKDNTNYTNKQKLPLAAETLAEFAPYLGQDKLVDPTLDTIKTLLPTIIDDEDDTWLTAIKLLNWVWDYIEPAHLLKPATTREILANRAGGMIEYVTLFTALARASGIPTRLAAGLRYDAGLWRSWVWNEIWLGHWVAVDPTYLQTKPNALLIKLNAAPCLATFNLPHSSTQEIEINVRKVDLSSGPLPYRSNLTTGQTNGTFTSSDFNCSLTLPENWFFTNVQKDTFMAVDNKFNANISLELISLQSPLTTQHIIMSQSKELSINGTYDFYPPNAIHSTTIAGYPAERVTWGINFGDVLLFKEQWFLFIEDQLYLLTFSVPDILYRDYEADLTKVISNFKIYD